MVPLVPFLPLVPLVTYITLFPLVPFGSKERMKQNGFPLSPFKFTMKYIEVWDKHKRIGNTGGTVHEITRRCRLRTPRYEWHGRYGNLQRWPTPPHPESERNTKLTAGYKDRGCRVASRHKSAAKLGEFQHKEIIYIRRCGFQISKAGTGGKWPDLNPQFGFHSPTFFP